MSEAIIENVAVETDPADIPMTEKKLDKGFKRNIMIIVAAILIAGIAMTVIVMGTRSKIQSKQSTIAATEIRAGGSSTQAPENLTQADTERLNRVQVKQSVAAEEGKETYIPKELPLSSELRPPAANNAGPGSFNQNGSPQVGPAPIPTDPVRDANIKKGLELQLAALLAKFEAPPAGSAGPYVESGGNLINTGRNPGAGGAGTGAGASNSASASNPGGTRSVAEPEVLFGAMKFANARLVSPLDTSKTDFVSVEITSGPLQGAYLTGKGKLVADSGVTLDFSRMGFKNEDYKVDVKALDGMTSSDSVSADVDKKILQRTIFPVVFTTAQAYLTAVSNPGSSVAGGVFDSQVVTPAASGRQAAAAGLAAGIGRLGEGLAAEKPSAYMPVNTNVSLLFNAPVLKKVSK